MPRNLAVAPHLTADEVVARFKACTDGDENLRWQAVMLKQEGMRAVDIARVCKRREDWVRRTVRRYNDGGPDGLRDLRVENGNSRLLSEEQQVALLRAIEHEEPPDGGLWTSPKVALWIERRAGIVVTDRTGLAYLRRLGFRKKVPRPRHPDTDAEAQEAFKKGGSRTSSTSSPAPSRTRKSRSGPRTKPDSD